MNKDNKTTKAPRKALNVDGWKAYEIRIEEIRQHNSELLESILGACPENYIVVVSQTTKGVDPYKWISDENVRKEVSGMHAFKPGTVEDALTQISAESVIRKFWYLETEGEAS